MVDRGRMLRESVRRDLSDRSTGGWEPDVPPGTTSDAESGGGMPVPDYESEDGRMRPWAGLDDDDDDDAAADVHSDFDDARSAGRRRRSRGGRRGRRRPQARSRADFREGDRRR